jgi:hypothetical protein
LRCINQISSKPGLLLTSIPRKRQLCGKRRQTLKNLKRFSTAVVLTLVFGLTVVTGQTPPPGSDCNPGEILTPPCASVQISDPGEVNTPPTGSGQVETPPLASDQEYATEIAAYAVLTIVSLF